MAERANSFGKAFAQQQNDRAGALLFIYLDDFKESNEQLCHAYGDQVLQQMAEWLCLIMPGSALCGRYGGDEFVVHLSRRVSSHTLADQAMYEARAHGKRTRHLMRV